MDLETLQVIFEMNTEKIKPKLDELQEKFSDVIGAIKGDTKSGMSDAEDSMDVGKGQQKVQEQMSEMNDRVEEFSKKIQSAMENGTGAASKAASSNFSRMKTNTTKEVGAMVADINTKMDQARAAEERMMNLKGLRQDALSVGDGKSASRINEQAESAQARMTRYQNQAKALAQQLKGELTAIPNELTKIAHSMDAGEGQIESLRRKIKGLEVAEKAAMKFDPAKGFNAEASIPTDQSRAIGEQIQKQKAKMQGLIDTNDALNRNYAKLEDRSGELKKALRSVNTELGGTTKRARSAKESFSNLSSKLSSVRNRLSSIMGTLGKVTGLSRLTNGFKNLNSDARSLTSRLATMGSRGSSSFNKLSRGANKSRGSLEELKQGLKSLPAQFLVWGVGFEAIQKFSQGLLNAAKTDRQFSNSLAQIKANLMTAFYPLYTAIIPWLDSFMSALAKATNWIASFSAALFGMSNSAARSGAANLYKQSKAMSDSSNSTKAATKALQQQNAAITKHNKAMQAAVQAENKAIQSRNAARRKAIQEQNAQIKASNEKRKAAVEAANEKIKASNAAVSAATKKQNEAQKKRIAELKKKYQDYKNSLMGFDEINTLDMSKDIPDYTPKTAKLKALEKFTATPTKSTSFTPEATKSYTPEATKSASDMGYVPDDVDNALAKPMAAMGGAIAAANKFRKVLGELFAPLKAAWAAEGKDVIDAFKYALREIERLLGDIGRSFIKVWDSKTGVRVITDILKLLATVLRIIGDIAKAFAEAWEDHGRGTKLIKSIFDALDAVLKVLIDIGKSFRTAWNDGTGEKIAAHLLDLFTDVNKTITELANSFRKAWNAGDTGTKLFSVWLHDLDKIIQIADEMVNSFRKAWSEGDIGTKIFKDILSIITNIGKLIGSFEDSFRKAWNAGDTGTKMFHAWMVALDKVLKFIDEMIVSFKKAWDQAGLGTKIFSNIFKIIGDIGKTVGNLAGGFTAAWKAGNTGQTIFHTILEIINDILDHIKDMAGYTAEWAKKLDFRPLLTSIKGLFTSIGGLNKTVWDALDWGYKNVLLPLAKFTITKALPTFFDLLSAAIKVANSVLKALAPLGKALFDTFLKPIASFTGGSGIGAIKGIASALDGLASWIDKHQKVVQTFAKVLRDLFAFKVSTAAFAKGTGLMGNLVDKATLLSKNKHLLSEFFGKLTGISDLKKGYESIKNMGSVIKVLAVDNWKNFVSDAKGFTKLSWSKVKIGAQLVGDLAKATWGQFKDGVSYSKNLVMLSWSKLKVGAGYAKDLAGLGWSKLKVGLSYAADLASLGWSKLKAGTVAVIDLIKGFKDWTIWSKAASVAQAALNAVMAVNPYVLLAAAIAAVITVFVELYKHNKKFRDFVDNIYKAITKWLGAAIDWLKDNWAKVAEFIINPVGSIATWFLKDTKTGKAIVSWGADRLRDAIDWAKSVGQGISDRISSGKKAITKAGTNIGTWVSEFRESASSKLHNWAAGLGTTISKGIDGAKSAASKAGSTLGVWVNDFRSKATSKLKDWASGLGSTINKGISGAKSLATKAGASLGSWVNEFRTKASKTVKGWANGLGNVIHSGISGAKGLATSAGTKLGDWVNDFRTKASSKIKSWSSGLGKIAHTGIDGAKGFATKAGEKLGKWVQAFQTPTTKAISKWAGGIGSKIAGGLKSGVNAISSAAKSIANAIVGTIGHAVNSVIDGLKWILSHVGAGSGGLGHWSIPRFAQGGVHQGGLAMVNDEDRDSYQESYLLPNGQQGIFPKKRNLVTYLPYGTKIKSAVQTEKDIFDQIPHYAKGVSGTTWTLQFPTGGSPFKMKFGPILESVSNSIMNSVTSLLKGINGGNVFWDANHPKDVINDKTWSSDNVSSSYSLGTMLARGMNKTLRTGATSRIQRSLSDFAQKQLNKAQGVISSAVNAYQRAVNALKAAISKVTGKKKRKGKEFGGLVTESDEYPLAEGNKPEMVIPLTKPKLALSYIAQSLQHMGYGGTSVTMPGAMKESAIDLPSAHHDGSTSTIQGEGVSGMQQAIVNAIMMAAASNNSSSGKSNNDGSQTIELTVKIGSETIGKQAIKGINLVNEKNGHNMLNL